MYWNYGHLRPTNSVGRRNQASVRVPQARESVSYTFTSEDLAEAK